MPRRTSRRRAAGKGRVTLLSRTALSTLTGVSERELALWEREELIAAAAVEDLEGRRVPLYDAAAMRRVRLIRTLAEDLGVNLPGIEVILRLLDQMSR